MAAKQKEAPAAPAVWEGDLPAGEYAMKNKRTKRVHFFSVQYGKPNTKWQGYTFVSEHEGPNRRQVRNPPERNQIVNAIKRDVLGCLKLYAEETGACGFCKLELTDPRSRENGYGKKCAENNNLPW